MLVIDPDICIDCGICVSECPIGAIVEDHTEEGKKWLNTNRQYAKTWPNIQYKKEPLPDADQFAQKDDKFNQYFEG